jgi:8-oxo-dGTP pyrophosphatase MutT (NUDIX family)
VRELGESIPDGLRREVREETGLTVEPDGLTGVYKNLACGVVALVLRCHATGGALAAHLRGRLPVGPVPRIVGVLRWWTTRIRGWAGCLSRTVRR